MYYGNYILLCLLLLTLPGCKSGKNASPDSHAKSSSSVPPANNDYFQEIGQQIGLDFIHSIGGPELLNIIESSCGGTAFLDYDQDGFIDIFVTSGTWIEGFTKSEKPGEMPHNHLYRNKGDGTFEDVTRKSGVGGPWYSMGVTAGDYDNDGYTDLYVCNYGHNVV